MEKYSLYHISHDDLDGKMPTILSKAAFGEKIYTRNAAIRDINKAVKEVLEKNKDISIPIYITDISVNDETAELLEERYKQGQPILLIDHHKTTIQQAEKYEWMQVIVERNGVKMCATNLYYEFLIEQNALEKSDYLDDLVELVRQYDTWDWFHNENMKAKQLNDLYYLIGSKKFEQQTFEKIKDSKKQDLFQFTELEDTLLAMEQEKINRYIETKDRQMTIAPFEEGEFSYTMGVVYGENYHSELGNALCRNHPEMDFVVIADIGNRKFSFRASKEEMDTSIIAKHFGGGGHPLASGCGWTEETYRIFIEEVIKPKIEA